MEFIRAGSVDIPTLEKDYARLCDLSHPTFVHHFFGPLSIGFDGAWKNPNFAKSAHELLEAITSTTETTLTHIVDKIVHLYNQCAPPYNAETEAMSRKEQT